MKFLLYSTKSQIDLEHHLTQRNHDFVETQIHKFVL